ncbi:MAG: NUDIX hydrolase [Candidatus Sungbacteria bacterium]|nr:NUDIX hydrolase [bacterium]MDZ4285449.1 NUDIX hydrolase [Candidatus Sungbacteria bacterium]
MVRCDHTSVGLIVQRENDDFLVIKRKNFPISYACVAGHCDGDDPKKAALRELREEVRLHAINVREVLFNRYQNSCRREGGTHHDWSVFEVDWIGIVHASSDAAEALWVSPEELKVLIARTCLFASKYQRNIDDAKLLVLLKDDLEWQENPGLEPVWCQIIGRLHPEFVP